ncbi:hypothetical protein [Parachitinimonas caeni]|uniref:Lipoprotein n=1 Tax=Parachitinimonas caeni TaxID=3031301 RepID=A0ABT7E0L3_9NEIS|nr:hypothetical protein [Parachitinimonas caeni]MDK2125853.1 hypothetical protein [Parachitinimonas caeni]
MRHFASLGLPLVALLAACAHVPLDISYLDGQPYHKTEPRHYPVRVLAIDGSYTVDGNPVRVEPGQRQLRISAAPVAGFSQPVIQDLAFTVEPCKRYYLAARRESPLQQRWELVVDHVESRSACT